MNSLTRRMTSSCMAATWRMQARSSALLMALMRSTASVKSMHSRAFNPFSSARPNPWYMAAGATRPTRRAPEDSSS